MVEMTADTATLATLEERLDALVTGFCQWSEIEANIAALEAGPLPADLQAAIDNIGLVHPLIYQNRPTL